MLRSRHPGQRGQPGVGPQVAPLAVHRHEVAGLDQVQHVEQLAGGRVPGDVHQRVAPVHDPCPQPGQLVDHPVHGGLVAGDQRGGEDHRVSLGHPDGVVAPGHPGQRRHRLALGPGGEEHDLLRRQLLGLAHVHHQAAGDRRDVQVAEVAGDPHVAHHGAADEGDLAPVRDRHLQHLLHPVHVAGETGDDDALLGAGEDLRQHRGDVPLAGDDPGYLGVGRVGHQQVHAVRAEPREPAEVGEPAVQRQLVHLEVAGVQDHAGRGPDGDRERVRDGVVHGEKLEPEGPNDWRVAGRRPPPWRAYAGARRACS